jgi:uncharacterized Rmd1/YagE family protein
VSLVELFTFKAFAFGGELDLNRLAVKLGITRKYRWEEPMKLNPVTFSPAFGNDAERVYLYYFGGVVFLNCTGDIIARFLEIKHKSETLLDMTDVFSSLSHARRSARLEWIIIILIAIEIVIYLMQLYRGH